MEIAQVTDQETLQAYLEALPEDQQRTAGLRVAFNAAARVLPIAARDIWRKDEALGFDLTPVAVFGALIASAVVRKLPTGDIAPVAPSGSAQAAANAYATSAAAADAACAAAAGVTSNATHAYAPSAAAVAYAAAAAAAENWPIDIWDLVRRNLAGETPVWPDGRPQQAKDAWRDAQDAMAQDEADWSIWIHWYNRILDGHDWHHDGMWSVLQKITADDWGKGPAHINPLFDEVLEEYRKQDATSLSDASPFEFTFDGYLRVMRLIGITDNTRHLRDPKVVQAFLDDAEQVRDLFQDFADDAAALSGGGNFAGLLRRKADNILEEFKRTEDKTHLRAEYLVIQAKELEIFAMDAKARADLGDTLADRLDERIGQLKRLCRVHFGPSYRTLAPLADLTLDMVDQDEVIRIFDDAIAEMASLPKGDLHALDQEGFAILDDMRRELSVVRAAIAEASTDEFRAILELRLAQDAGALGLAVDKFYQRNLEAGNNLVRHADTVIRTNKRVSGLRDILDMVTDIVWGGGA